MFRIIIVLISIFCALFVLYGVIFAVVENEPNRCRMTYMFEYPQFVRVNFAANKYFPKYALYAYSEGALTERTRSMDFSGAPVIFIPGNAGSFKQARSLASVALRSDWFERLDYFSIDFNEEYNGLFGGYLEHEQNYAKACVRAVLNLYSKLPNKPTQVVLVGHSMGGKIAQSLLTDDDVSTMINTVITIATPIDEPVLKLDEHFAEFYKKTNSYFETNRNFKVSNNETNACKGLAAKWKHSRNESLSLDDKLIISFGGGSRDFMVHSGLTFSKYSDINSLTTSTSNVWVTTDHLCSVWCLQLVLVINRFLHSIVASNSGSRKYEKSGQQFIEDKSFRLAKANHFFVKPDFGHRIREIDLPTARLGFVNWEEDSRRVFSNYYEDGLNYTLFQMIRLTDLMNHRYLSVVAINVENDDNFLMGCSVLDFNDNMRYCRKAISLSNYISRIPTIGDKKIIIKLDLNKIKEKYPDWTHIILRFNPTRKWFSFSIDIFDPESRTIKIQAPKWNSYGLTNLLDDTLYGSSLYKFEISGIDESYQSVALFIKPRTCLRTNHHSVARVCVPWMANCDKYQHFTNEENRPLYIEVPKNKPHGYNTTTNPIVVQLHLDTNCRYRITYQNSFGGTMYRIMHQYFHWIPAHMVGILLMAFRHQITITPKKSPFKCGKLQTGLLVCSSFFIITMSRIFGKLCQMLTFLPELDAYSDSIMISLLIHGTAFAILMLSTLILWLTISIYGNMAHKIVLRIIKLPISLPSITDSIMPIIEKIPISSGIILVVIASSSCGGVALIVGWLIYFMQILKQYEDYLEEFVYDTAKLIAEKLFGKLKSRFYKKDENSEQENAGEGSSESKITDLNGHDSMIESKASGDDKETSEKEKDDSEKSIDKTQNDVDQRTDTTDPIKTEESELRLRVNTKNKSISNNDEQEPGTSSKEVVTESSTETEKAENKEAQNKLNNKQLSEKSEILLNAYDAASDEEFPEDISDAELNKLLDEAIMKQRVIMDERRKKESLERLEYDGVHDSFSSINFHFSLLILLGILMVINLPATISWAKNYAFSPRLIPDPSFVPALVALISISTLWQFGAPRNVYGYTVLSGVLYVVAGSCVLYCQDSIYRLNYIVPAVFVLIVAQQLFLPKKPEKNEEDEVDQDLKEKIERMRTLLQESGDLESAD